MSKNKNKKSTRWGTRVIVKDELKVELLKKIVNFKSKEYPDYKLKNKDVINVLSQILARKTE